MFSLFKKINTKHICLCGVLTALISALGILSVTISNIKGKNVFQITDGVYISLLAFLNPYILILSSILGNIIIDVYAGGFIYIPITIIIKLLIGITYLLLKKHINHYINGFISYLWIFLYVLYAKSVFDNSVAIHELIIDSIQYGVTIIIFLILFSVFKKIKIEKLII